MIITDHSGIANKKHLELTVNFKVHYEVTEHDQELYLLLNQM